MVKRSPWKTRVTHRCSKDPRQGVASTSAPAAAHAGTEMGGVRRALAICLLVLWWGCAAQGYHDADRYDAASSAESAALMRLETDLAMLLGYSDPETRLLARTLLVKTAELAEVYRIQAPALWHNFLVNSGRRDRGLCCHWTEDLLQAVEALRLRRYHAEWGVSRRGSWREHNSVILTASGKPFASGLVIDAWRDAGDLFWTWVADDVYPWRPHPGNTRDTRIRCR